MRNCDNPYYNRWKDMRRRSKSGLSEVCNEWEDFLVFKEWMEKQNWKGLYLDKDILFQNNKIYSPTACRFVPARINSILTCFKSKSNGLPVGVSLEGGVLKPGIRCFKMGCGAGKNLVTSWHYSQEGAHLAWQEEKIRQIQAAVSEYSESNSFLSEIAHALLERVTILESHIKAGEETKAL